MNGTSGRDERPWGHYAVVASADDHLVKRIVVRPGKRVSYQRHERRAEHWFVVRGRGRALVDGVVRPVEPGTAVDVPIGSAHRIENTADEDLVFIEIAHGGDYFGEDDIVRLEDDYGRASP